MFEKILYPIDFSEEAKKALEYVKRLKDAGGNEVVLLHVIDRRGLSDLGRYATKDVAEIQRDMEKKAMREINPIEKELKERGFKVKVRIERGGPYNEILRVADEENVSLIVTGSRGTGNIEELLLGSVSYKVVRKIKKPILVVK